MRGKHLKLTCILLSTVALPTLARAQSTTVPLPVRTYIDANDVDLFSGIRIVHGTTLSAGPDQRLTYQEIVSYPGTISHSIQGAITTNGSIATVSIGDRSEKFSITGQNQYQPVEARGSSLVYGSSGWVYTTSDGTVYTYDRDNSCCTVVYRQWGDNPVIRSIKYKDGTIVTYNWKSFVITVGQTPHGPLQADIKRVAAVYSNAGYSLNLRYKSEPSQSNQDFSGAITIASVIANNTALDGCTDGVCPATNRPSLYLTYSGGNTPTGGGSTDSAGQTTNVTPSTVQEPGETTTYTYDGANRVASAISQGVTTTYGYSDTNGIRTVTATISGGAARILTFNIAQATLLSDQDETNRTTSYQYDSSARVTRITAPEGNYTAFGYDGRGNVTSTTIVAKDGANFGMSAAFPCTIAAACNSPTSTVDARGNTTNYDYSPTSGLLVKVTSPAAANGVRPEERISYTQIGGIWRASSISQCRTTASSSCIGTADESKTSFAYGDNRGLPSSITIAAGDNSVSATSTRTYDAVGYLTTVDGPLPGSDDTTRLYYDSVGRQVGKIGPDPDGGGSLLRRAVRSTYNGAGVVTAVEVGTASDQSDGALSGMAVLQGRTTTYDSYYRPITESLVAGGTTYAYRQTSYDTRGRVDCVVTRMNPAAFTSTSDACALGSQGSFGPDRIERTGYDAANRVLSKTTALGTAEAATETLSYTSNGQSASVTDGNGNVTAYDYDNFDRLLKTRFPLVGGGGASSSDYEQYGYDNNGNITSRRLRDGQTIAYGYDALNRRTLDDNPNTNVAEVDVTYSYDLLGRPTQAQDGNGWYNSYSYDALGRLTGQSSNVSSNTMQYDAAGRRTRQTWADGFFVTYEYDATDAMTAIRENGGSLVLASFAYDNLGRRTSLTRGNGTSTNYGYDPASRLTSLFQDLAGTGQDLSLGFTYTPAGQIAGRTAPNDAYVWNGAYNVDRSYGVNGLNQLTSAGATTLSYDARGNLTNSGGTTYQYNTRNQLFMNGAGQLFYRGPNGLVGQSPNMNYDYVGAELVTEHNGGVVRRYVYGPGVDEPLVWYEGSGTADRRYLHADERGSIVAVTNATGSATAINTYDEFGIPGTANQGRFQYTGQKWIAELGMYDYKARMYSPTLGRFMQTDPIGYQDGLNWYDYVGSDPINNTDPLGMCAAGQIKIYTHEGVPARRGSSTYKNSYGWTVTGDERAHTCVDGRSQPTPQPTPPQKTEVPKTAEKTDLACGVLDDGVGCRRVPYSKLCKGAKDRISFLAKSGSVAALFWTGYRNRGQLASGKGGQKWLGVLQQLMAAEVVADIVDEAMYCD